MALMLAAIMMMAMSVTAFAAGTTHSLTVNVKGGQDLKGQTINLYKLFDVTESGEGQNKNYAYTVRQKKSKCWKMREHTIRKCWEILI